jgi:hypothetical protein
MESRVITGLMLRGTTLVAGSCNLKLTMTLTLNDVRKTFQNLLDGSMTRDEADRWAYECIQKHESNNLVFSPLDDKKKIWSGLMYLYGVDSKNSPNEYLHTLSDIREAMHKKLDD